MRYCFLLLFLLASPAIAADELTLPLPAQKTYSPDNDLIYRIHFGSEDDIRILLDKGANPNAITDQGDTALIAAIIRNDHIGVAMAKILLDKGANPNLQNKNKDYPIILATKFAHDDLVAYLIAKGADFHVHDTSGQSLISIAKQVGNTKVTQIIQDQIDREEAYAASMQSPERFNEIIRRYSFYSCAYQYWSYYLSSRQNPDKNADTEKKIADSKAALATLLAQIQKYYPTTTAEELQNVADSSARNLSEQLDAMISNYNRGVHGVGTQADADSRCEHISDQMKPDYMPSNLRK